MSIYFISLLFYYYISSNTIAYYIYVIVLHKDLYQHIMFFLK